MAQKSAKVDIHNMVPQFQPPKRIVKSGIFNILSTFAPQLGIVAFLVVGMGSRVLCAETQAVTAGTVTTRTDLRSLNIVEVGEPVVLSAAMRAIPARAAGQSITTVGATDLDAQKTTDLLEPLRATPGMFTNQSGARGQNVDIHIRGSNANHTLVMMDGVRVNESGGAFNFGDISAASIDRVEIIRGPQSALYGAEALGGAINIISKKGRGPAHGSLSIAGGSFDTFEGKMRFEGTRKDIDYSFDLERVDSSGHLPINNGYRNTTAAGQFGFELNPRMRFRFISRFWDSRTEMPSEFSGDRFQIFTASDTLDPEQYVEWRKWVLSFHPEWDAFPWWRHEMNISNFSMHQLNNDPFNTGYEPWWAAAFRRQSLETRRTLDYRWIFTPQMPGRTNNKPAPVDLTIAAGYEIRQELLSLSQTWGGVPTSIDQKRKNEAVYGELNLDFLKRVSITPGFRSENNSGFGSFGSPKVSAAIWIPESHTKIRANWGRGFKQPSFFEQFGDGATVASPNLKPERSRGWDAGIDQSFLKTRNGQDSVDMELTYFNNRYFDTISYISMAEGFKNVQTAAARGLEALIRVKPAAGLEISGGYTLTHSVVLSTAGAGGTTLVQGQPLIRRPRHAGSLSVSYKRPCLRVAATALFIGRSIDRDFSVDMNGIRTTLYGWAKVNLSASFPLSFTPKGRFGMTPFVRIENLLNRKYEESFGFSAPGISAIAGTEVNF